MPESTHFERPHSVTDYLARVSTCHQKPHSTRIYLYREFIDKDRLVRSIFYRSRVLRSIYIVANFIRKSMINLERIVKQNELQLEMNLSYYELQD